MSEVTFELLGSSTGTKKVEETVDYVLWLIVEALVDDFVSFILDIFSTFMGSIGFFEVAVGQLLVDVGKVGAWWIEFDCFQEIRRAFVVWFLFELGQSDMVFGLSNGLLNFFFVVKSWFVQKLT